MTDCEEQVLELAIRWRDARYTVEAAMLQVQLRHAIDLLKKERRDAKVDEA